MIIAGSSLEIAFAIGEDITGLMGATISYISPLGHTGTWTAGVVDVETGRVAFQATPSHMSETGVWRVWATYAFPGGVTWKTPAKQFTVYAEGTVQR